MAPGLPGNALDFTARREQARGSTDNSASANRPPQPPYPVHGDQQQGITFPPNADIAHRRQLKRQALGDELRFVGPPTIVNPDELLAKKQSSTTLIEEAKIKLHLNAEEDVAALASQVASFQLSPFKESRGTFDDTDSIMTTDPDYVDHDKGYRRHPTAVATDYNKGDHASNPNLKFVASEHANQMRGQVFDEEDEEEDYVHDDYAQELEYGASFDVGPDWRADVAAEKALRGVTPSRIGLMQAEHGYYAGLNQVETRGMYAESSVGLSDEYAQYDHDFPQDDRFGCEVDDANGARTSTQAKNHQATNASGHQDSLEEAVAVTAKGGSTDYLPTVPLHTVSAKPLSSKGPTANSGNQAKGNTAISLMAPPPKPGENKKVDKGKQAVRNAEFTMPMRLTTPPTTFEPKATSFGDSSPSQTSEDELTLPDPNAKKLAFEESLDYSRDELAGMSYADLDREPFLSDPKGPTHAQPAVEETLEHKLSAMTDMSEEECKTLFASLTDAENEGAGQWFMQQMLEKMKALMLVKHQRRMIAAKYEHEVKRRNALVNAKTKDVANEVEGLKRGLENLMPKTPTEKDRRVAAKVEKKAAKKASQNG